MKWIPERIWCYFDGDSEIDKIFRALTKESILIAVFFLATPVCVAFCHELSHALTGMYFGWNVTDFTVGYYEGLTTLAWPASLEYESLQWMQEATIIHTMGGIGGAICWTLMCIKTKFYAPLAVLQVLDSVAEGSQDVAARLFLGGGEMFWWLFTLALIVPLLKVGLRLLRHERRNKDRWTGLKEFT